MFLSASVPNSKLSNPRQTWISRLVAKKPVSAIPFSRKSFAVNRALGLGLSSFLKNGNTDDGIEPREEGDGGECGG